MGFQAQSFRVRTAEHQLRTIRVACAANLLLVLLLLTRPAALQAQFTFTTNNGAITITKYTGPGGAVTIPSTINGLPVTSIGNNAFRSKTGLTSVTIPDSVIRIGVEAFRSCPSLTNIAIGMNVASIESGAFEECASLTKVTIPSSVTNIGPYHVFNGCNGLTNITVAALNSVYGSLDGILFDKSQTTLITYPAGLTGRHYTIPHNVVSIGFDAFLGCLNLTSVTIPDGLIRIGEEAFRSCRSLTNIAIGTNVASIESSAFEECAGLTKVTIPNSVTNIGPYPVFLGCGNLTNITVDSLNFDYCSMDGVLFNKSKTTLLTYPPGMSESHYTIPDSVVSIGQSAFLSPVKLTSVTIPNGVTYLDQFAFYACLNLTNVTMGSGVTNIGPDAFYLCWSLTNIALPDSVTSIGDGAFYYCSSLASIVIPASVTSIGVAPCRFQRRTHP